MSRHRMKRNRIRFGVVTAWPEDDWHSQRLLAACDRRGLATALDPADLACLIAEDTFTRGEMGRAVRGFDVFILARGLGRRGDPDAQFEIYRALEGAGAAVMNRIDPLLAAQDKFRTSWLLRRAGIPTPNAAVAQTPQGALEALAALGDAVVKPMAGSLGDGIERMRDDASGRAALVRRLKKDGVVYLQAFVGNPGRDVRVFVIGGRAVAAVERRAPAGAWLTNVALGAEVIEHSCSQEERGVAERAAIVLGLDYAGVDLAADPEQPTVIEVNGNPSWKGILAATGRDMAEPIAEHALSRATRRLKRWPSFHMGAVHG